MFRNATRQVSFWSRGFRSILIHTIRLFDERLIQCNEELAMLESSTTIHPELVAMKEVIDQRRDQKLHYEQTLLRYRLQTLQRDSVANKAQAHSQYMQTVRELRDSHLEQLNENFYQLQRERRNVESDVPDYMLTYTTKRSQQIIQQTAYNTEVSLLAGIAKHVGFPAAPEIRKARVKEMEDDLRSMGVSHVRLPAVSLLKTTRYRLLLRHPKYCSIILLPCGLHLVSTGKGLQRMSNSWSRTHGLTLSILRINNNGSTCIDSYPQCPVLQLLRRPQLLKNESST